MHTTLLDEWAATGEPLLVAPSIDDSMWSVAAAVIASREGGNQRPASVAAWDLTLHANDQKRTLRVRPHGTSVEVSVDGASTLVELRGANDHELRYSMGGVQHSVVCVPDGDAVHLVQHGSVCTFREASPWPSSDSGVDPRLARAPVAGTIAAISVSPGDEVQTGQQLVCVEAMKMEMWLVARSGGKVRAVHVALKESVEAGAVLVELEIEETT
jgi:geranyl-CoA carboxylase alpha subunit